MRRAHLELGVLSLLSISSCSLLGLDELEPIHCVEDADCEPTGRAFPDPTGCHRYVCGEDNLCVLPSSLETCNGEDDDCNGWIDDGIAVVSAQRVAEPESLPSVLASASNDLATYVVTGGDRPEGFILHHDDPGAALEALARLRYVSSSEVPDKPCPSKKSPVACNFAQLAMAGDSKHLVYAAVSSKICNKGLLRVGLSRMARDPFSVQLGKAPDAKTQDPSYLEYGVQGNEDCATTVGASYPAVAALDAPLRSTNALVVWLRSSLAAGISDERCTRADPAEVHALGAFVPEGESGWLNATDAGVPTPLGESMSRSAPAVLALDAESAEFLVAFATSEGGADGLRFSTVGLVSRRLELHGSWFHPAPGVDRVTLALGPQHERRVEVGVTWSSGCEIETALNFATLSYAQGEVSPLEVHWTAPAPGLIGAPHVRFEPEGFATAPRPAGGWSLMWLEASNDARELKLARLAEAWLSEPVSELPEPITLRPGRFGSPVVYSEGEATLRYALAQLEESGQPKLETIGGWCDVRE